MEAQKDILDIQNYAGIEHHSPLSEEDAFWNAVSSGDIDYVRRDCAQNPFTKKEGLGILARDPVVNFKYHFVIAAAMIARICMKSGMEMEQAFRLSDYYILRLENADTVDGISELHMQMVLDFAGKMRLLADNPAASKPVVNCVAYIREHIQERVSINDLAEYTGLSVGYLSRLFKKETGVSISDYIREKKVEKAREMLQNSDMSLPDIASRLSFSSQSHFTQQFRAFTGVTPKKYRVAHSGGRNPESGEGGED